VTGGLFWIIGCGNMAGAMLRRWVETGMDTSQVRVVDPALPTLPGGLSALVSIPADALPAGRILLAVKPQLLDAVAADVARLVGPQTQLLSILAGVEIAALRDRFPEAAQIVRVMPNLPAALGKGVIALHSSDGPDAMTSAFMAPLGLVEWIPDEAQLHLVASLAASGPAFLYRFIDALGVAGARLGLTPDQAARLALATVEGSALLAAQSGEAPAVLADRVASNGGMTREGLDVLDADEALVQLLADTLDAAARRSAEMGNETRRS
jgi:pyrroline-5-carboxylate reductase